MNSAVVVFGTEERISSMMTIRFGSSFFFFRITIFFTLYRHLQQYSIQHVASSHIHTRRQTVLVIVIAV